MPTSATLNAAAVICAATSSTSLVTYLATIKVSRGVRIGQYRKKRGRRGLALGINHSVLLELLHQFQYVSFRDGRGQLIIRKVRR